MSTKTICDVCEQPAGKFYEQLERGDYRKDICEACIRLAQEWVRLGARPETEAIVHKIIRLLFP